MHTSRITNLVLTALLSTLALAPLATAAPETDLALGIEACPTPYHAATAEIDGAPTLACVNDDAQDTDAALVIGECGGGWHYIEYYPYFVTSCLPIPAAHSCPGGTYVHGPGFITSCLSTSVKITVTECANGWHAFTVGSLSTACLPVPYFHRCTGGYYVHGPYFTTTCIP